MMHVQRTVAFIVLALAIAGCSAHSSAHVKDNSVGASGSASAAGHSGSGSGSVSK
jgi:hypothetical protein